MNTMALTVTGLVEALSSAPPPARETVVAALERLDRWYGERPPVDATGDTAADMRLADLFRTLLYVEDWPMRKRMIQTQIIFTDGLPPDDPFQRVARRWWLDIDRSDTGAPS